jgi:predicted transcriptional regulator YheO
MRCRHDAFQERQLTLTVLKALQALGSVVVPRNVEILHDLDHPEHSVVAIVNGQLSGARSAARSSLPPNRTRASRP